MQLFRTIECVIQFQVFNAEVNAVYVRDNGSMTWNVAVIWTDMRPQNEPSSVIVFDHCWYFVYLMMKLNLILWQK